MSVQRSASPTARESDLVAANRRLVEQLQQAQVELEVAREKQELAVQAVQAVLAQRSAAEEEQEGDTARQGLQQARHASKVLQRAHQLEQRLRLRTHEQQLQDVHLWKEQRVQVIKDMQKMQAEHADQVNCLIERLAKSSEQAAKSREQCRELEVVLDHAKQKIASLSATVVQEIRARKEAESRLKNLNTDSENAEVLTQSRTWDFAADGNIRLKRELKIAHDRIDRIQNSVSSSCIGVGKKEKIPLIQKNINLASQMKESATKVRSSFQHYNGENSM